MFRFGLLFFILSLSTVFASETMKLSRDSDRPMPYWLFWPSIEYMDKVCKDAYYWSTYDPAHIDMSSLQTGLDMCLAAMKLSSWLVPRFIDNSIWYFRKMAEIHPNEMKDSMKSNRCVKYSSSWSFEWLPVAGQDTILIPEADIAQPWTESICPNGVQEATSFTTSVSFYDYHAIWLGLPCISRPDVLLITWRDITQRQLYVLNTLQAAKLTTRWAMVGQNDFKDFVDAIACASVILFVRPTDEKMSLVQMRAEDTFVEKMFPTQYKRKIIREDVNDICYNMLSFAVKKEVAT